MAGRAYARGMELKSHKEWTVFSKSGQRSSDIPANPDRTYRDDGWISWPDWLGSEGRVAWKSFTEGRAYMQKVKLMSSRQWQAWCKSGQRPRTSRLTQTGRALPTELIPQIK